MRLGPPIAAVCAGLAVALAVPAAAPAAPALGEGADLMNIPVTVTTRKQRTLRDAPGVVTVLTREDIQASGARNLMDLLLLVPGLQFGVDVEGGLGPSVRGLWGTEGKVLLLVDGQEMNERLYGTNQFGPGLPIDLIERIEIIRGPGSVVYGGFAELAVIQISTVRPLTLKGLELHGTGTLLGSALGQAGGAVAYGQAFGADVEFSALASAGYGVQSVQRYVDLGGRSSESPLNAQMPRFFDVGARYRDLSLRLIYDDYRQETADGYGETLDAPVTLGFQGLFADVQYALRPCEGLSLTPRVAYKRQSPWRSRDTSQTTFYDKTADQLQLSLMADFDAIEDLDVLSGAEFSVDKGRLNDRRILGTQQPFRGENGLTVLNGAGYVQAAWSPDLLTVVAGIRTEFSDRFTASVVPRLGLMHNFDRFYVKGLATRAFRTPALENIGIQGTDPVSGGPAADIEPEQTTILELEGGYLVPYLMSLSVNVFDMHLRNPIIFNYDPALGGEVYRNDVSTGTQGLEAVARAMGDWGQLDLSYSTYSAAGRNHVRQYAVAEDEDALLGAARHKVALLGRFSLPGRLWLAPSAVFLSERAYVVGHDTPEPGDMSLRQEPEVALEPPSLRLNWFLNWAPGFAAGLHLGAGVFDVFDSGFRFAQPHDSGHAPLPDRGREFVLKLGYALPLGGEAPPE